MTCSLLSADPRRPGSREMTSPEPSVLEEEEGRLPAPSLTEADAREQGTQSQVT